MLSELSVPFTNVENVHSRAVAALDMSAGAVKRYDWFCYDLLFWPGMASRLEMSVRFGCVRIGSPDGSGTPTDRRM